MSTVPVSVQRSSSEKADQCALVGAFPNLQIMYQVKHGQATVAHRVRVRGQTPEHVSAMPSMFDAKF